MALKVLQTPPSNKFSVMTWVLIIAVVALVGFTIMYIYQLSYKPKEQYTDGKKQAILTYIYSNTCPYCVKFNPVWQKVTESVVSDKYLVKFQKVENTSPSAEPFLKYMDGIPMVHIEVDGKYVGHMTGYNDEETTLKTIKDVLESSS
jgi:cytochrome oxidase Cu insertion factor (SCO1/SenC/PrrC family)